MEIGSVYNHSIQKIYEIQGDFWSLCRKVAIRNDLDYRYRGTLFGPTGHLERCNVWTHLIATFFYLTYASFRPLTLQGTFYTISSTLAWVSAFSYAFTFFCSTFYHVCSVSSSLSVIGRIGDYLGIYISFAISFTLDLSLVSSNLKGVGWIPIADVWFAVFIVVAFFLVRRAVVPIKEERLPFFGERCSLGFARFTLHDKEHAPFRSIFGVALILSFLLNTTASLQTGISYMTVTYLTTRIVATLVILIGMALDNIVLYPDNYLGVELLQIKPTRRCSIFKCICYDNRHYGLGCVMSAHSLWHILAFLAAVINTVGTEVIVVLIH